MTELHLRTRRPYRVHCVGEGRWWIVKHCDGGPVLHRTQDREEAFARKDELNAEARRTDPPEPYWATPRTWRAVRQHLDFMAEQGIGVRSVALAADMSRERLIEIYRGKGGRKDRPVHRRLKYATAERILAVTVAEARRGKQIIDAGPTWQLLDELLAAGWTKTWIGRQLGSKAKVPSLQIARERVTVANARRVREVYMAAFRSRGMATPEERRETEGIVHRERDRNNTHPVIEGSRVAYVPTQPLHNRAGEGFSSAEICHVAGLSYRQLDYWERTELLVPSIRPADGSGTQRRYSFDDLVRARVIVLLHHGATISLQKIRRALVALAGDEHRPLGDDVVLVSDGHRVYLAPPPLPKPFGSASNGASSSPSTSAAYALTCSLCSSAKPPPASFHPFGRPSLLAGPSWKGAAWLRTRPRTSTGSPRSSSLHPPIRG